MQAEFARIRRSTCDPHHATITPRDYCELTAIDRLAEAPAALDSGARRINAG